jgi:hypothetical protein
MMISSEKYKKMKKKKYMSSTVMYCSLTNNPVISVSKNCLCFGHSQKAKGKRKRKRKRKRVGPWGRDMGVAES